MSYEVKGIVLKKIKTLLTDLEVGDDAITYFPDYFGKLDKGINLEGYQQDDESSKHSFGCMVNITLNTFSRSITTTTAITRAVLLALKASVNSTIQLSDGWQATYTLTPSVTSLKDSDDTQTVHRDVIRLQVRVDETN
jgi:hypothetical protein